jgi:mono/diheme cytochrome c family protein
MIGNTRGSIAGSLGVFLIAFLVVDLIGIADARAQRSSTKSKANDVYELFRNNCARCHGADGRGDTPLGQSHNTPDFTNDEWWKKNSAIASTRSLMTIVRQGKGEMPAFGEKLKPNEISGMVKYVRKFRQQ